MITYSIICLFVGLIFLLLNTGSIKPRRMTKSIVIHLTILIILDIFLVGILVDFAWQGNDKAIIVVVLGYLGLTLAHGLAWFVLSLLKKREMQIYKITFVCLIVLFMPIVIVSGVFG